MAILRLIYVVLVGTGPESGVREVSKTIEVDVPVDVAAILAQGYVIGAEVVNADPVVGVDESDVRTVSDIVREQMVTQLERNEWNIARVARLMGCTRRTIYLRLQRYGISRKRVPKGRKAAA